MASTSSVSSHPPPAATSELLSRLKLQDSDGVQVEEMVTFKESEKTNHHRNYVSKTTQYSTSVCFTTILTEGLVEILSKLTEFISKEQRKLLLIQEEDIMGMRNLLNSLKRLEELEYGRNGFTKVTLRDLSHNAKVCLGFVPRTNKNIKDYVIHPGSTATTFFGTIYWEAETIIKCFDVLPHDVIDLILANLPTEDIFRYRSVCKRWDSMLTSNPSFQSSFRESTKRRPWFLVLDALISPKSKNSSSSTILPEAVYNMELSALGDWCQYRIKIPTPAATLSTTRTHKVIFASSGGLICSMSGSNSFIISNPCTGTSHQLPPLPDCESGHNIKGMALHVSNCSKLPGRLRYQVFVVIVNKDRTLRIKAYSSPLKSQEHHSWNEKLQSNLADPFLNLWNPKKIVGVTTICREGRIMLHFLTHDGSKSVCCDTHSGTIFMNPRFLPALQCCKVSELVVCDGTLYVVLILSGDMRQPLASAQLQVHKYYSSDENEKNAMNKWRYVSTLPEEISANCCINKKDHNHTLSCAGYGNHIMVYVTCASSNYALMFNIKEKSWVLLPPQPSSHTRTGHKMEICSLMPDID